jgi:hypothetical protein
MVSVKDRRLLHADAEPSLATVVTGTELDDALAAIGDFAELKSPWLMGHARGVADLARSCCNAV